MSHRIRLLLLTPVLLLAGPLAGTSAAESVTFTTPGIHEFRAPQGVTRVHVVAVGGRGGGASGGFGAVVTGDISVPLAGLPRTSGRLRITVPSNGGIGAGGSGGGGETAPGSLAGGGGGAARIVPCGLLLSCTGVAALVAAGGGGSGSDSFPGLGGAGGSAGVAGTDGFGVSIYMVGGGGGGGAGGSETPGTEGSAGGSLAPECADGLSGAPGESDAGVDQGGTGAESADPFGFGDGGGGGGGLQGGGGGGSGGYCPSVDEGLGGGGGGGGSSLVPRGGTLAVDTSGVPSMTISWTVPPPPPPPTPPSIAISTPADGAVYPENAKVLASYACHSGTGLQNRVRTCAGTVRNGRPISTRLGRRTFRVTATVFRTRRIEKVVHYTVTDQTAPRIMRPRVIPRSVRTAWPAFSRVVYRLSEWARIRVTVGRISGGSANSAARTSRTVIGRRGVNRFRLRARLGRRRLAPGRYVLTLIATDRAGNRSKPATRRFAVVE